MITVACLGSFIKVYNIDKKTRDEVWQMFKFKDKKKIFQAQKNKLISPYYHPYDRRSNVIGIGFLDFLLAFFESKNIKYELKDYREFPNTWNAAEIDNMDWQTMFPQKFKPRYYQIDIWRECLARRSGIISSPTASGKTLILAGITKLINVPTLILFDQVHLCHQTRNEFIEYGFSPKDLGVVQAANNRPGKITFATIQSREKLYDFLELFKCIIVDECHTAQSRSFHELFAHSNAPYRFGLSATPWAPDDPSQAAKVMQYIGPVIYDKKGTKELIEEGILAKPKIKFVVCDRSKPGEVLWKSSGGRDYPLLYREEIAENTYRNMLVVKLCAMHRSDKIIILFQDIKNGHGQNLHDMIVKFFPGRSVKLLTGENTNKERDEAIKFFEKNENGVILASVIFNKGVNVRSVNVVVNAAAGKGFIPAVQRLGRGLRKTDEKDEMTYYDFYEKNSRVFYAQSKRRMKIYENRGHKVDIINIG